MIDDKRLDESNRQVCLTEGNAEGTPEFDNCMYMREREQAENMREAEQQVDRKLRQQEHLMDDYRTRL